MLELICDMVMVVVFVLGFGVTVLCVSIGVYSFIHKLCDLISNVRSHVRRWNKWRKNCTNGWFHKFLVLVGLRVSPTMTLMLDDEEVDALTKGINRINIAAKNSAINLIKEVEGDDADDKQNL